MYLTSMNFPRYNFLGLRHGHVTVSRAAESTQTLIQPQTFRPGLGILFAATEKKRQQKKITGETEKKTPFFLYFLRPLRLDSAHCVTSNPFDPIPKP